MATHREIYEYIKGYREENGWSPSVREMCRATGIKSTSTMYQKIRLMESCGMVRTGGKGISRTVVPIPVTEWRRDADARVLRADEQEKQAGRSSATRRA